MAEETIIAPAVEAAAPVTPAPVDNKAEAPAPDKAAAPAEAKPADKVADFVAKKSTLLGEDPDAPKEAEGEKKEEPGEVKPGTVPEKYEVKAPEGMQLDTDLLEAVSPMLKEKGFTQEEAQKLVDVYAARVQQASQKQHDAAMKGFDDQVAAWGKETKEMLGPDSDKKMVPVFKSIKAFAGPDAGAFRQLMNDTGLGNHPLMVKFLINAGKAISQDSFVDGGQPATDSSESAARERFYPSMKK